ncbi:MAG TPA: hypothetical protein VFO01_09685 [Trebonia sp.]|nr:hypothetical protein [Trebonia sp.]
MRVRFPRLADHQKGYSVIERDDGAVYRLDGAVTGPGLPHDLRHLIVERELRVSDGLFGAIAAGTVYLSMHHLRGRQSPRAAERPAWLKKAQRDRIMCAEMLANLVEAITDLDDPSPYEIRRLTRAKLSVIPLVEPGSGPAGVVACPPPEALAAAAEALQVEAARWARLRVGEELVYEWPASKKPEPPVRALRPVPGPAVPGPGDRGKSRPRGRP